MPSEEKNTGFCVVFAASSERVENTVFCDVFSARGFKCTANTTVFFMFLLPVLKASQPKTVVFTVFWQDNMQKQNDGLKQFFTFFQLVLVS